MQLLNKETANGATKHSGMIDNFVWQSTANSLSAATLCSVSSGYKRGSVLSDWVKLTPNDGAIFLWGISWHTVNSHALLLTVLLLVESKPVRALREDFVLVLETCWAFWIKSNYSCYSQQNNMKHFYIKWYASTCQLAIHKNLLECHSSYFLSA